MKKIYVILIGFLILCLSVSFALAQENDNQTGDVKAQEIEDEVQVETDAKEDIVDLETEKEIEVMIESNLGAQVKILQLQKAVTKSYLIGSQVIELLADKEEAEELSAILAEVKILKEEAENLNSNSENAVEEFVHIKKDIKNLNSDFRKIAAPLLTAEQKQQIHDYIKDSEEIKLLNQKISENIRELNQKRVQIKLERMGLEDKKLLNRIRSGKDSPEGIRKKLKKKYAALNNDQKNKTRQEIINQIKVKKAVKNNYKEKVKLEYLESQEKRLRNRLDRVPDAKKHAAKKRINSQIANIQKIQKQRNIQNIEQRKKQLKNQIVAKRAKLNKFENNKSNTAESIDSVKKGKVIRNRKVAQASKGRKR